MRRIPVAGMFFFFNDTATTEIYTLSLHDALPIYEESRCSWAEAGIVGGECDSHLSWRGSFGQSPVPPLTPDGSDCHVVATQHGAFAGHDQIGRASCRERV